MKIAILFLVTVLVLTPAAALAQTEKQLIHNPAVTTESELDPEKLLQLDTNQQIQKFNASIGLVLAQTRKLKQFSTPYEVEFQRRNEQIQRNRDVQALPRFSF